jgi:formyl-CoA transferase
MFVADSRSPLNGLRVLDLSYVFAVPYMGGLLSDLGAEVIKVEAPHRLDQTRATFGPYLDNDPGDEPWNRTGTFHMLNRGKRSFVLDLGKPAGRELLKKLVAKSDMVLDNFTPRVMRGWDLHYEQLRKLNPALIMLSNTGYGSTGPWAAFPSQGTTLEATMGITHYSGYRNDKPWKVGQSYPDFLACWSGLFALLVALHHRRKTGEGQWIDLGMYQIGAALIPEPMLQLQADGSDWERIGNEHRTLAPYNVYPAGDDDAWIAISITNEEQWQQLVHVMGKAELLSDTRFRDMQTRLQNREALDELMAGWTRERDAGEMTALLQGAGVPAGPVLNSRDLLLDAHLRNRRFYELVEHAQPVGLRPIIGRPFRFRFRDLKVRKGAPRFGEGNSYVLRDILGMGDEEIGRLYVENVVSDHPTAPREVGPQNFEQMLRVGTLVEVDPDHKSRFGAEVSPAKDSVHGAVIGD